MSKRSDTLKFITTMALNYAHYHMTVESLDVNDDDVKEDDFLKMQYDFGEQIDGDDEVIILHLNNVNITEAVNVVNNLNFGLDITYILEDSTVTEMHVAILDIDFIENEDVTVYIKDFINNYLKYSFSGIVELYLEYEQLSLEKSDQIVNFGDTLLLNFILDKKNNIQPSIKTLFLNDMDVIYDIDFKNTLINELAAYSPDLEPAIRQIVDNNQQLVTELYDFDYGVVFVNSDLLKQNYNDILTNEPDNIKDLMKALIVNSAIRSGQSTLSNMLALYDDSELLSVNMITYSVLLSKNAS